MRKKGLEESWRSRVHDGWGRIRLAYLVAVVASVCSVHGGIVVLPAGPGFSPSIPSCPTNTVDYLYEYYGAFTEQVGCDSFSMQIVEHTLGSTALGGGNPVEYKGDAANALFTEGGTCSGVCWNMAQLDGRQFHDFISGVYIPAVGMVPGGTTQGCGPSQASILTYQDGSFFESTFYNLPPTATIFPSGLTTRTYDYGQGWTITLTTGRNDIYQHLDCTVEDGNGRDVGCHTTVTGASIYYHMEVHLDPNVIPPDLSALDIQLPQAAYGIGSSRCSTNCTGLPVPESWWTFEANTTDVMGTNDGAPVRSVSTTQAVVNGGLNLSGKPAGATINTADDLNFGSGVDFSIDAWVNPALANTSYGVMELVSKRLAPNNYQTQGYELCLVNGKVVFQMASVLGSPLSAGWTGSDLRDGLWHHVAVTVQRSLANGGKIYVDGNLLVTFDPTSQSGSLATSAPLLIGMHPLTSLDCNFRGGVDEVALYSRALTVAEVQTLHNLGTRPSVGLVGWWPLEGDATDVSGAAHTGAITSTLAPCLGEVGFGYSISGKPGGVTVSDAADLNFASGVDFSLELWVQPQVATTSYGVMEMASKRIVSGGQTKGYELCLVNGQVVFQMSATMGSPLSAGWTGPDLRDGHWHHVAVTVQRGSTSGGQIYVDGVLIASFNPTSQQGDLSTTASLLMGLHPDSSLDGNFRGNMDEVSLYRRALSAAEVGATYAAGPCGKCKP